MTGTGPVLVGCDGSSDTDDALRFAVHEARLRAAPLVIVCAYLRPVDPDLNDFDLSDAQLRARAINRAEGAVRRALGLAASADLGDLRLVAAEGDPAHVLVEQASDAALIVIGSHERSVFERFFGHHTSRHLLHEGQVPVVVVPCRRG